MFLVLFCSQKFDSCVSDGRTDGRTDRPTDGHTSYKDVGTHLYSILQKPSQPKPCSFVENKNSKQTADVSLSTLKTRKNKTIAEDTVHRPRGKKVCLACGYTLHYDGFCHYPMKEFIK